MARQVHQCIRFLARPFLVINIACVLMVNFPKIVSLCACLLISTHNSPASQQDPSLPDWDQLLPDLLLKIASYGVTNEMRGASKTWRFCLESCITALAIRRSRLPLNLATRFLSLTSLDLTKCTLVTPKRLQALEALPLTSLALRVKPDSEGVPTVDFSRGLVEALMGLNLAQLKLHLGSEETSTRCYVIDWLECFSDLPVVSLHLEKMEMYPIFMQSILSMPKLIEFTLSGENHVGRFLNERRDYVLHFLQGKSLTALNLEDFHYTILEDANLEDLKGMPLASLTLDCGSVTDTGFGYLRGLPLSNLQIELASQMTDSGLENMLSGMPLTDLKLVGMKNVTGSGLRGLRGAPLTRLDISQSDLSGDAGEGGRLPSLAGLPLTDINVWGSKINDVGLECLRGLPLTRADFVLCLGFTGSGFAALKGAPLRSLILGTPNVGGPDSVFYVAAEVLGRTDGLVRWEDGGIIERIVGSDEEGQFLWEEVDE